MTWTGDLRCFVIESNRIEEIRGATKRQIEAHSTLLRLTSLGCQDIAQFVRAVQPKALMRVRPGLNVRVGNHIAPPGGPEILPALEVLLSDANDGRDPWSVHCRYETLHPFSDGNGRSGRAIWLWQMGKLGLLDYALRLGFLRAFYYATLSNLHRP